MSRQAPPEGLMSAKQAAKLLGQTPHMVLVDAAQGRLQTVCHPGRPMFIVRASAEKLLAENRKAATAV